MLTSISNGVRGLHGCLVVYGLASLAFLVPRSSAGFLDGIFALALLHDISNHTSIYLAYIEPI